VPGDGKRRGHVPAHFTVKIAVLSRGNREFAENRCN
jgi:hypothetical protein